MEAEAAFSDADVNQEVLKCRRSDHSIFARQTPRGGVRGYRDTLGLDRIYFRRKCQNGVPETHDRFLIPRCRGVHENKKCEGENRSANPVPREECRG